MPLNIDVQQILLHLLNFVLLFGILYFLLYSPVKKFMNSRTEQYKEADEKVKTDLEAAEAARTEYESRLAAARTEIENERQAARRSISEQSAKTIDTAKREAARIINDANKKAENDRNRIIEKASEDIADMVAEATEKIVVNSSASESYDSFLKAALGDNKNERSE